MTGTADMPHNQPDPSRKWVFAIVALAVLVAALLCVKG